MHRFAPPTAPHGRSNCTGKGWDSRLWAFYHKGIPIAADSGIDSSIRVHARAHIIVLYQPSSLCQFVKERDGRPRRTKDAGCCKACNPFCLSGRVCSQADVLPVSRPPKTTRQPSRPIPMPMQPSIAFHQNCCTAGTPISHHAHCSHLTKFRVHTHQVPNPTLTHTENRTKKHQCVPLCIINVPSNPLNPSALGRHRPARYARCLACPSTRRTGTASQRPAQRWRSALTARNEVTLVPIGWRPAG